MHVLHCNKQTVMAREKSPEKQVLWDVHSTHNFLFAISYQCIHVDPCRQASTLNMIVGTKQ